MSPVLRTFEIRVERFAEGGSEVVTVAAVNRAGAWSRAAARVDDPDNIWRTIELYDLPPHNTHFTAHWLDEWDDEWNDEKLRRLLYQDMDLTIFSADDALIMNYIRRP